MILPFDPKRLRKNLIATLILPLAVIAKADLVGYYPFDDAASSTNDVSGKGANLTGDGADPTYEAVGGLSGGAYSFDGSQRWIAPININPDAAPQLTLGAWVKTASLAPGLRKILGSDNGGWDRTIGLDDREGAFRYTSFIGNGPPIPDTASPTSTEDWTFIAAVYNDGASEVTLYVDTNANTVGDDLKSVTKETGFGLGFESFAIGGLRPDNAAEGWIGKIDNVFVFDEVLTADQLTKMRNVGNPVLNTNADPNFSVVSVPDLTALSKGSATHDISIPIRNDGASKNLDLSSVKLAGADAAYYSVKSSPTQLTPGQTGTIIATLNPQGQVGQFHSRLEILSSDSIQPRTTLDVSATVVADGSKDPSLVVTIPVAPAVVFGDLGAKTTPTKATITLQNKGTTKTLSIAAVNIVGSEAANYTIDSFVKTLAPNAKGTIALTFDPKGVEKAYTANLEVVSDDSTDRLLVIDLSARVASQDARKALIGFYPFDDATAPLTDASGKGNNLRQPVGAAPTYETTGGFEGGAFTFNGTQRITVPININPGKLPELTMGGWVQVGDLSPGLRKFIGHDDGGWDRTIGLDNREGEFRFASFIGNGPPTLGLPAPESTEDWIFFAASFNQPRKEVNVYLDLNAKTKDDDLLVSTAATLFATGFSLTSIGSLRPDNRDEGWIGQIDNVFFYSAALTPAQLTKIRNGGKSAILEGGIINSPFPISGVKLVDGKLSLTWSSLPSRTYSIDYTSGLSIAWTAIGDVVSQGTSTSFTEADIPRLGKGAGFYRVVLKP